MFKINNIVLLQEDKLSIKWWKGKIKKLLYGS